MKQGILLLIFYNIVNLESNAQSNTLTIGDEAVTLSGSISYTVGQIDYVSSTSSSAFMNQGLQQPFEFFIVTGLNDEDIELQIIAYPNPVKSSLILDIGNLESHELYYQLSDLHGNILLSKSIESRRNMFDFPDVSPGSYFLQVRKNYKEIKSFKIIKNQ